MLCCVQKSGLRWLCPKPCSPSAFLEMILLLCPTTDLDCGQTKRHTKQCCFEKPTLHDVVSYYFAHHMKKKRIFPRSHQLLEEDWFHNSRSSSGWTVFGVPQSFSPQEGSHAWDSYDLWRCSQDSRAEKASSKLVLVYYRAQFPFLYLYTFQEWEKHVRQTNAESLDKTARSKLTFDREESHRVPCKQLISAV